MIMLIYNIKAIQYFRFYVILKQMRLHNLPQCTLAINSYAGGRIKQYKLTEISSWLLSGRYVTERKVVVDLPLNTIFGKQ
jgi:hypothetical protein